MGRVGSGTRKVTERAPQRSRVGNLLGQTVTVLVEEKNEQDDSLVTGRMSNNTIVHFPGGEDLIGTLAEVHLDECHGFYYIGH